MQNSLTIQIKGPKPLVLCETFAPEMKFWMCCILEEAESKTIPM